MTAEQLEDFIKHRMRMSHIYQPVMLKVLLEGGGQASVEDIAKNLAKGHNVTANAIDLDKVIEKNFSDAMFYSHTLRTTKDEMKKEVTETRLDIAKIRTEDAKRHLDCMIFN